MKAESLAHTVSNSVSTGIISNNFVNSVHNKYS